MKKNTEINQFVEIEENVEKIFRDAFNKLNLKGRKDVLENGMELRAEHLINPQKPEEFTKKNLIEPLFRSFNCDLKDSEVQYQVVGEPGKYHYVDLESKFQDIVLAIQAKPMNQPLATTEKNCAVNQVKDGFKNTSFYKRYQKGAIATDGIQYIIINARGLIVDTLNIKTDYIKLQKYVTGKGIIPPKKREEISEDFYKRYNELMHGGNKIAKKDCFINSIHNVESFEEREEIAQITINRLLFLKFLYERRLIKAGTYSKGLFEYLKQMKTDMLNSKLKELFFNVMNTPENERGEIDIAFCTIPYLNGSLFRKAPVERKNSEYIIDSKIIKKALDLLDSYNFSEGEIDGEQVRIDPEILGYIFERAMTAQDRKGTGSFYTKKSITTYQARKAIQQCILDKVNPFLIEERGYREEEHLEKFDDIYFLNETTLAKVREIIKKIKICDNSCGSGAFVISAAMVLFDILRKIEYVLQIKVPDITIKKHIIRQIYGVDINSRAIDIAMLRVWLWVAESFHQEYMTPDGEQIKSDIEPLPNLEYHFMTGNALIGYDSLKNVPFQTILLDSDVEGKNIKELLKEHVMLKEHYQKTSKLFKEFYPDDKMQDPEYLKKRIDEIREKVKEKLDGSIHSKYNREIMPMSKKQFLDEYKPFHWAYEFFEVFNGDEKGFDIIIGNPPYIQLQRKEMISENVRKAYELKKYDTFKKTGDIYCLFYERSLDLLKENGKLCYITSNKWMRAGYGDKLRELLSKYNTDILIDFAGLKNFKAATVDTNIILISKKPNMNDGIAVKIKDDFDEQNGLEEYVHKNMIPLRDMSKEAWFIGTKEEHALKKKIEETGKPLKEWDVEIYRGILTGYNKAFIIDEKTKNKLIRKDPNSADIIKPILRGRDIKRYRYEFADIYLINTHNEYKRSNGKIIPEIKIEKYPAIKKHLDKHWEKISKRHDKGKTPYNLRNCTYLEEFEKENIAIKAVGKNLAFSIVEEGVYVTAPASIITSKYNKYMLGMLCSNYSRYFIYEYSDRTGAGDIMLNIQSIEKLPIPEPTDDNKKIISAIEQKVNAILEKKKQDQTADTKKLEEQIDLLVYIIFDLDYEMVKTIDPEFPLKKNIYLQKKAKLTR